MKLQKLKGSRNKSKREGNIGEDTEIQLQKSFDIELQEIKLYQFS